MHKHASTIGRRPPGWRCAALALVSAWACAALPAAAAPPAEPRPASAAAKTITEDQAIAAALKVMPGKVTGTVIEKKRGRMVYVVEIMTADRGEKDVFVDRVTGKVIGTD